ncbi:putative mitochondrial protein [Andalucia godoyi]|uniref:Putative mitochondrial protein n=1 Tax=Andalucia godoyi TaxID=505711 RepID=A0A8K0F456_ANDGO|nr:putative mitochondrial protein [Andalucia godoyi]|eukprot:ANDGO_00050.mRNA.1 putative mitochondrial protein
MSSALQTLIRRTIARIHPDRFHHISCGSSSLQPNPQTSNQRILALINSLKSQLDNPSTYVCVAEQAKNTEKVAFYLPEDADSRHDVRLVSVTYDSRNLPRFFDQVFRATLANDPEAQRLLDEWKSAAGSSNPVHSQLKTKAQLKDWSRPTGKWASKLRDFEMMHELSDGGKDSAPSARRFPVDRILFDQSVCVEDVRRVVGFFYEQPQHERFREMLANPRVVVKCTDPLVYEVVHR